MNYSNSMSGWSKGFELMIKKEIPEDSGFLVGFPIQIL
ncbi:hypothetical protein LEP1GSC124_4746 [Leptospira interrogans serovar Pyrogenes str. 200701872]|uniref:Uncharacterized protein n=1 Tax=Leptospira interrogans serovar Pyrogenes str. 200701872 TaxID=1193029 RepID=M6ZLF7_LEPIR|nr:hypothetical protein LEP1GSC124_4746 [Leptospira interrogans serovar Pyrogenes str. 200701872]